MNSRSMRHLPFFFRERALPGSMILQAVHDDQKHDSAKEAQTFTINYFTDGYRTMNKILQPGVHFGNGTNIDKDKECKQKGNT